MINARSCWSQSLPQGRRAPVWFRLGRVRCYKSALSPIDKLRNLVDSIERSLEHLLAKLLNFIDLPINEISKLKFMVASIAVRDVIPKVV